MEELDINQIEKYALMLQEFAVEYGLKIIGAVLALIVGLWVVSIITKGFKNLLSARNIDPTLVPFLSSLVSNLLKVMVVISVAGMVGIEMTSFVAVLGAAGLAIGLALSGTLQNFAGGVLILILRPFKVGDWIEAQGYSGTVNAIQIFNTFLKTPDNKTVIIPNGPLSTGSMVNYSAEPKRRVDFTYGIGYGDKVEKAREILSELIKADERIINEPAEPFIGLHSLGDSSVNLVVRVWVNAGDYWGVYFDMNEKVYNAFSEKGINIPFPQMDVHLFKEN
jgi:small conductance mechanosensitive channel